MHSEVLSMVPMRFLAQQSRHLKGAEADLQDRESWDRQTTNDAINGTDEPATAGEDDLTDAVEGVA